MVVAPGQKYNVGERPTVILYAYINRHAGTPKAKTKSLGTAQFCYVGSSVGWVLARQAGMLIVNWRRQNESAIMFMVFAEVLTGRSIRYKN